MEQPAGVSGRPGGDRVPATVPTDRQTRFRALLHRHSVWVVGALLVVGAALLFQFLIEAVMVCFIGNVAGVAVGIGGGLATSAIAGGRVIFTVAPIVIAFACAFLTGIIFGYLPARKAAQLDPIEALARD